MISAFRSIQPSLKRKLEWNRAGAPCTAAKCIYSTWRDGGYASAQGTSMATPHISGVAALLVARGYRNTEILPRLRSTADDVGVLRVNAARAVGTVSAKKTTTPGTSSGSGGGSTRPATTPGVNPRTSASGTPGLPPGLSPMPLSTSSQKGTLGLQGLASPPASGPPSRVAYISVATGFAMLAGAGYVGRLLRTH